MLRINQIKLPYQHTEEMLKKKVAKILRISEDEILNFYIKKKSIDARKKPDLFYVYSLDVKVKGEKSVLTRCKNKDVSIAKNTYFSPAVTGNEVLQNRPVVIGSGPAGLFCTFLLAQNGYQPILLERGASVEERMQDVEKFWSEGILNPESNIQFGEGGAGTFSDGKLNTSLKDPLGLNRWVLKTFVDHGAPKEILYEGKPHIGTDILTTVIRNIREHMLQMGAEIRFHSKVTDFITDQTKNQLIAVEINDKEQLSVNVAVLAIGHSARDTFQTLYDHRIPMTAKSFAVGVRAEHPQTVINVSQYGMEHPADLPAAPYKLTAQLENGRGVYSFCMCPGGYVVNASSELGRLAVNGMSYHDRAGENANSAIVVTVTPEDFASSHPLAGMEFQRDLEEKAYALGSGSVPVQRLEDFKNDKTTSAFGKVTPQIKGNYQKSNLRSIFPQVLSESILLGMECFESHIHGFSDPDTLLSGVESRTSSPIRISRNEFFQSELKGLYPCGEGAGYAGGITSAAMDGLKVAEGIMKQYKPLFTKN
ncbi:MAG: FAD-dependent oxidoreductase [Hespellia sp.]|nr:FAD-dependent oxidoreductase [Hespellia sp.]